MEPGGMQARAAYGQYSSVSGPSGTTANRQRMQRQMLDLQWRLLEAATCLSGRFVGASVQCLSPQLLRAIGGGWRSARCRRAPSPSP